jgi:hypothetical protein
MDIGKIKVSAVSMDFFLRGRLTGGGTALQPLESAFAL